MGPHPLPNLGQWPELEWESWKDTAATLHMYMQIVGKIRLGLTPTQNHWWNVPFYLTARGLSTSAMPVSGGRLLDIEFDLLRHQLVWRTSSGGDHTIALRAEPVAEFFRRVTDALAALEIDVKIDRMPVEIGDPVRFDRDFVHGTYDANAVERFWRILSIADALFKRFSTGFYGKISPVHFFWGALDLAVTRFNGRTSAVQRDDPMQSEAYSHEVISAGFWPGNGGYGRAAFYAYAAPIPEGLEKTILPGKGAWNPKMGEFVLDYEDVRKSSDPVDTVLEFLDRTYSAAADLAGWDRERLDRRDTIASAVRLKEPQNR